MLTSYRFQERGIFTTAPPYYLPDRSSNSLPRERSRPDTIPLIPQLRENLDGQTQINIVLMRRDVIAISHSFSFSYEAPTILPDDSFLVLSGIISFYITGTNNFLTFRDGNIAYTITRNSEDALHVLSLVLLVGFSLNHNVYQIRS